MLSFFRRYQRFFFIIITVVIVISFSFFGTYSALMTGPSRDQTAFTSYDGVAVSRMELDQMALFLGTDSDDKLLFGGVWGPNFLNDGVIKKDFIETGLAEILVAPYYEALREDLDPRLDKEKRYTLYTHPQAKFIGADAAWGYFAPDLKKSYQVLQKQQTGSTPEAFAAREQVFLAERKFPSPLLKQVLRYQEKQYSWLVPDQNLEQADLSLFGYHTLEDWFGPRFVRLVSQFIINVAKMAEQKGYQVSSEEAFVDLMKNAEASFQQNQGSPYLGVAHVQEYFAEQLRRLSLDQAQAVKIWRQVLLFRRLFDDVGNSALVDAFEIQKLDEYAKETAQGDLYQLPKSLHLSKYKDLQMFEIYLTALSRQTDPLSLPTEFFSISEVEKQTPELVQKRYLLEISEVNKKNLQAKVGIKDTWNWEVEDKNWELLKNLFPELGLKKGSTRDERFAALDSLDDKTRAQVDSVARQALVDINPEWLTMALAQAKPKKAVVGLRNQGGATPFAGLDNPAELSKWLDQAPLEGEQVSEQAKQAAQKLTGFTADQKTYYNIKVLARSPSKQILTYAEAHRNGTLDNLLKKKLESHYLSIREAKPQQFQKDDKTWKDFADVQDLVADDYFAKVIKAISEDMKRSADKKETPASVNNDVYATHRLGQYMRTMKAKIQANPEAAASHFTEPQQREEKDPLAAYQQLSDQWKLEKIDYKQDRGESSSTDLIPLNEALALAPGGWSKLHGSAEGNMGFFQLKQKVSGSDKASIAAKMEKVQQQLSYEAQRILMVKVMDELQARQALSLQYLNPPAES